MFSYQDYLLFGCETFAGCGILHHYCMFHCDEVFTQLLSDEKPHFSTARLSRKLHCVVQ